MKVIIVAAVVAEVADRRREAGEAGPRSASTWLHERFNMVCGSGNEGNASCRYWSVDLMRRVSAKGMACGVVIEMPWHLDDSTGRTLWGPGRSACGELLFGVRMDAELTMDRGRAPAGLTQGGSLSCRHTAQVLTKRSDQSGVLSIVILSGMRPVKYSRDVCTLHKADAEVLCSDPCIINSRVRHR